MSFFFFNDTATTEIYTLSLHDALPICMGHRGRKLRLDPFPAAHGFHPDVNQRGDSQHDQEELQDLVVDRARETRSEEHTSELQSRQYLVCRLLLEKKKKKIYFITSRVM